MTLIVTAEGVTPPVERPYESAGYLGYYCKTHLGLEFDLVDVDGTTPVCWIYRKAETRTLRFIEEKPQGQQVHPSQNRVLRYLAGHMPDTGVYVIYNAERLTEPTFPIRLARLGVSTADDKERWMDRADFDRWLLDGTAAPRLTSPSAVMSYETLLDVVGAPYTPPDDLPLGVDWQEIDGLLRQLAVALLRSPR